MGCIRVCGHVDGCCSRAGETVVGCQRQFGEILFRGVFVEHDRTSGFLCELPHVHDGRLTAVSGVSMRESVW